MWQLTITIKKKLFLPKNPIQLSTIYFSISMFLYPTFPSHGNPIFSCGGGNENGLFFIPENIIYLEILLNQAPNMRILHFHYHIPGNVKRFRIPNTPTKTNPHLPICFALQNLLYFSFLSFVFVQGCGTLLWAYVGLCGC